MYMSLQLFLYLSSIENCIGNAEDKEIMGFNPMQAWTIFKFQYMFLQLDISWWHNCNCSDTVYLMPLNISLTIQI